MGYHVGAMGWLPTIQMLGAFGQMPAVVTADVVSSRPLAEFMDDRQWFSVRTSSPLAAVPFVYPGIFRPAPPANVQMETGSDILSLNGRGAQSPHATTSANGNDCKESELLGWLKFLNLVSRQYGSARAARTNDALSACMKYFERSYSKGVWTLFEKAIYNLLGKISRDRQILDVLLHRLAQFARLIVCNAPEMILENRARSFVRGLLPHVHPSEFIAAFEMFHERANSLLSPEFEPVLGRTVDYRQWAEEIFHDADAIRNGHAFELVQYLRNMEEENSEMGVALGGKFHFFYSCSDLATKIGLSREIFEKVSVQEASSEAVAFVDRCYDALISVLPRRVGLLPYGAAAQKLYESRAMTFLGNAIEYRKGYDEREGRVLAEYSAHERQATRQNLAQFLTNNPSPEMLKMAFQFWSRQLSPGAPARKRPRLQPGTRMLLVSDRELNALNWITKNIPKGSMTRDARRQLHDFVLGMVERRIQREDDPVAEFMGELLVYLKTNLSGREEIVDTVQAFLDFAVIFTNTSLRLQRNGMRRLRRIVSAAIRDGGEKFILTAGHFRALKAEAIGVLLSKIFEKPVSLSSEEVAGIRQSIDDHPDAWFHDNLLIELGRYAGFQDEEGRRAVEQYLLILSRARIEGVYFRDLPRYEWPDPEVRRWFGESLIRKIQGGFEREVAITNGNGTTMKNRYGDVFSDILTHMELSGLRPDERRENVRRRLELANKAEVFEEFWSLFEQVVFAINEGGEIPPDRIEEWKRQFSRLGAERVFPYWAEVVVNFGQLGMMQRAQTQGAKAARFVITEEPVAFIRSGEVPVYTCQRINEPTGFNRGGLPINRPRQGHFFLGQMKTGDTVEERSVLEIARERQGKKKVLLVERFYSSGVLPRKYFQSEILRWAAQSGEIDYVVFASLQAPRGEITTTIELELLPVGGEVYRDTSWPEKLAAIDIAKWQQQQAAALPAVEGARGSIASQSRRRYQS